MYINIYIYICVLCVYEPAFTYICTYTYIYIKHLSPQSYRRSDLKVITFGPFSPPIREALKIAQTLACYGLGVGAFGTSHILRSLC